MERENEISGVVLDRAIEVHRVLGGPGLLEAVYEEALAWELERAGLPIKRQHLVPIHYKGQELATPLRLDLVVDDLVIVECKSLERYHPIVEQQVLTYLRLTQLRLGLVINFGNPYIKDGFHRIANGVQPRTP